MTISLATVDLEVADPQASRRYYVDGLGLQEDARRSHPPDFVYLTSSGAGLTLARPDASTVARPSPTVELGFATDDVDAVERRLRAIGVASLERRSMGWGEALESHDLDGHRVVIYRLKPHG